MTFKNSVGLSEYAADSTYAFPDIFSLACGVDQADLIPKAIAFHPIIRGFLKGFGGTTVRVDALRLNLDAESQAHVTNQAIATIMNRFVSLERFEASIEKISTTHLTSFCAIRT